MQLFKIIKDFDLNLLRLALLVHDTGSISMAAKQLKLTQPAASNALKRLRTGLDDELFIVTSRSMQPTAFAQQLVEAVRPALVAIDQAISKSNAFDPLTFNKTISFGVTDYAVSTITHKKIPQIIKHLPQAKIFQMLLKERNPHDALASGELDFSIGAYTNHPTNFYQFIIQEESYSVICRKGHPLTSKRSKIALDDYAKARHLLIAPWGSPKGAVDDALAALKRQRTVVATVPYFFAAIEMVVSTDLISTVPSSLASLWKKDHDIEVMAPPLNLDKLKIALLWHKRVHTSPVHQWIREAFKPKNCI